MHHSCLTRGSQRVRHTSTFPHRALVASVSRPCNKKSLRSYILTPLRPNCLLGPSPKTKEHLRSLSTDPPSLQLEHVSSAQGPCRVPATRPSGQTSRSNSPRYPRRGVLPHTGDCPTLTPPLDGSDEGSTLTTIYHGARSRAPYGPRVHGPLIPPTPP